MGLVFKQTDRQDEAPLVTEDDYHTTWSRNYMDPFGEDDKVDTRNLKEHSDLWFWWRDQDFFGATKDFIATAWETFGIGILAVVFIIGAFVFANYIDNQEEAETYQYKDVARWTEEYPELVSHVEAVLSDDILTEGEYEDIKEQYEIIDHQFVLEKARGVLDEALQQ